MTPQKKIVVVIVAASATAVLVAAAAVEVWVRAAWDSRRGTPGFYLSDPVRGHRLAEDYSGWFAGVPVHVNSLGLRDPREYDLRKNPNTFRILVLGDSVTFGHGSIYEHTYPYLLEHRLKQWRPDIDWQVWNAAVPGYNTSQELAQLLEVGPRFRPDLVIVGFYENDLLENRDITAPSLSKRAASAVTSFVRRHVYSAEFYRRVYYTIVWRITVPREYRARMESLAAEDHDVGRDLTRHPDQRLTPYERFTDEEVHSRRCVDGNRERPDELSRLQQDPALKPWRDAVRAFQALHRDGRYRILWFLNVVPRKCYDGDFFYDGATRAFNDFLLQIAGDGTPAVSCHDAFLHVRPSQMPNAAAHSLGNANAVKADVLFDYLSNRVLPDLLPQAPGRPAT